MPVYSSIEEAISQSTKEKFSSHESSSLSGGSISRSKCIKGNDGRVFFCKENDLSFLSFFKAEAKALQEIKETNTIRTPDVITSGTIDLSSFLLLEFIQEGTSSAEGQKEMGKQLARLHKIEQPFFGWTLDNCIGSTPQPNPRSQNWVEFYRIHRLQHQFQLAARKGQSFDKAEKLLLHLESFFQDYTPYPSLLHGDLWGGNASHDQEGNPFIFDPASYYGDREADVAFTYMFGGFSPSFYEGYEGEFSLNPGFKNRKILYNLYHELNHFNLFGGGYASSAQSSIHQLVSLL